MLIHAARQLVNRTRASIGEATVCCPPKLGVDTIDNNSHRPRSFTEGLRLNRAHCNRYPYTDFESQRAMDALFVAVLRRQPLSAAGWKTPQARAEWTEYLQSYKYEDGLFHDSLVNNDSAEVEDWWDWRHLTLLALMAITALGSAPRRPLAFLARVDTPSKVLRWLATLDWNSRVSFTSNAVQNYGAALQYARDIIGESSLKDAIIELLAGIAERGDRNSGLWGSRFKDGRKALSEGVQSGYHFWLLFWYEGQDIPFAQRAFDSILKLQNKIGGFSLSQLHTTACQDIDGLDPLVRLALRHPELAERTYRPVVQALRWILSNFNQDGGATFQRNKAFTYGHELMSSEPNQSSIFATWFRLLSLGLGLKFLESTERNFATMNWRFLDVPGLQFEPGNP